MARLFDPGGDAARLDVRDAAAFAAGHLPGSGHIPLAELRERRAELPSRDQALVVVADDGSRAEAAAVELVALGYPRTAWLDAGFDRIPAARLVAGPAAALWRPSPFLAAVIDGLPRGRALDLAAGAGREAVTLALGGWSVEAWDHDAGALERAAAFAIRQGVRITTRVVDLERREVELPVAAFEVVTVFRFLHRPLFPAMAGALVPGGMLVYETFRRGQERFGRPRHPRFLLEDGELARAFPSLEPLRYEELESPDGPVLARLLARRPG
ncbi:MAG: rhodanese-like domain-containing protein [Candidatus Eisenbacteria bacterium]